MKAGIEVEKDASLYINSNDVIWLNIVPSRSTPNAIKVDRSLKIDSGKITSWNPETNDYVKFSQATKYNNTLYSMELRPYIKVNSDATGPTIIQNSELAYLGYSCSRCGGVSFNDGENSILKNNDMHHIYKGFYSKGNGKHVNWRKPHIWQWEIWYRPSYWNSWYDNQKNIVYDNYNAGIICSADCYNIIIEENKVYNNGHGDNMRGIAVSKNVSNTIIKNNIVYDEDKCISIGRDSYDNSIYDNTLSNCLYGVYITKNSSNNEIHDNNIENVGYGLVAADESINNVFHSNTVTDTKIQTTLEDESSIGNAFKNNKKMVSFDTLEKNNNRGKKYK